MNKKINKFIRKPGEFWRDFFIKRYPLSFCDAKISVTSEKDFLDFENILASQYKSEEKVDIVYTWVDSSDHKWQSSYLYERSKIIPERYGKHALSPGRFSNHNELKYSIISVMENMPWINNIFIVTDNQKPDKKFLNSKCHIIDHHDIIEDRYLPTFNSHVIEAHLHKIEDLQEKFIYFNDDIFVLRKLPIGHFYRNKNIASIFCTPKKLYSKEMCRLNTPTYHACLNCNNLLSKRYGKQIDMYLSHTYYPLMKSSFSKVYSMFFDQIEYFFNNKFRTNNDFNLASFLVPMSMFIDGNAVPAVDICYYFNINANNIRYIYNTLTMRERLCLPHSCCINSVSEEADEIHVKLFDKFCKKMWSR